MFSKDNQEKESKNKDENIILNKRPIRKKMKLGKMQNKKKTMKKTNFSEIKKIVRQKEQIIQDKNKIINKLKTNIECKPNFFDFAKRIKKENNSNTQKQKNYQNGDIEFWSSKNCPWSEEIEILNKSVFKHKSLKIIQVCFICKIFIFLKKSKVKESSN